MTAVELICKAEDRVVARINTNETLSARSILSGLEVLDRARTPLARDIQDGVQMQCQHCASALYFRAGDGELVPANPGNFKVEA